jgi:2-polyprenyl-3-methyl-5-hydroxy-6-metoxy-1,4-benzoquinol methylase
MMDYLSINKKLWNDKTSVHYQSDFYDVKSFIKGKDSLNPIEIELLGDISGKSVLHLQCHFGMDSISLARRGARVTGIDLSDESIKRARELNEKSGTKVDFILSDVYSLPQNLDKQFDIVFTSYGTVGWLPDMNKWADVIRHFLKPDGKFIMVEFHPVLWMFDDYFKEITYKYMDADPIIEELKGTYANREASLKNQSVSWNHGLARVIDALLKKGLVIDGFQEYDYSPYDCFYNTIEVDKGKYQIRGLEGKIPMLYTVSAVKKHPE